MTDTKRSARTAQDSLVLLGLVLAGLGLAVSGSLLPVPFLALIGLPIAIAAAIVYALLVACLGGFEVGWPRQVAGLGLGVAALGGLGHAYLTGLGIIAAHYLGRAGAPPLSDLWTPATWVAIACAALGASIVLRRRAGGVGPGVAAGFVSAATVAGGWGLLIVLAILGIPLGA